MSLPIKDLTEEKINTLRAKLGNLEILIIDEISMVDHRLLSYIHGRLRQIKQPGDNTAFAKVCIIAVGDFYQLPPVKGSALYSDFKYINLWEDEFHIAELTQIVRQKDSDLAHALNRIRTHKKDEPLLECDLKMFKSCETGEESDALHIFATNKEVDDHNLIRLHATCPDSVTIKACDYERNSETGRLEPKDGHHHKVYNTCLQKYVSAGIGARIMLLKNIDVSDGLVNGAFGTIVNMVGNSQEGEDNENYFPTSIHVAFDDPKVGQKQRSKTRTINPEGRIITVLAPEEDKVTNNGGLRRQYPIRLAWACTVHKVQGLTIDKAVVSLSKIFSSGQAYVALSRVTSLSGLTIKDFKESAIYCNAKVADATSKMPAFISSLTSASITQSGFTIILHNTQSLKGHFPDVQANAHMNNADCICLTETWLGVNDPPQQPSLTGFQFTHFSRGHSYDNTHPELQNLKHRLSWRSWNILFSDKRCSDMAY